MEPYIKDNLNDITYLSELPPLIRFAFAKVNQNGGWVIRPAHKAAFIK